MKKSELIMRSKLLNDNIKELKRLRETGTYVNQDVYASLQGLAIEIGEGVEERDGDSGQIVPLLEKICDLL